MSSSQTLEQTAERLNKISPSFCPAKWLHCSLHLHLGRTHSCHLPHHHVVALNEIKKNPSALHNTSYKKDLRKMMLKGERPKECQACWDIEDLPGKNHSERHFSSQTSWSSPFIQEVSTSKWNKDFNPTYLEVSFSSACQFKCSYCGPTYSTSWMKEIEELGPYKLTQDYQCKKQLRADDLLPLENDNPYREAFWNWWPSLKKDLLFFRITGGEPLLQEDTFKTLELINNDPMPKLELSINSNMGVAPNQLGKFIADLKALIEHKKIKRFNLHTSLDTFGVQAEYIRFGLDFKKFEENIVKYLEELPSASLSFTCTFNALSIVQFKDFLSWIVSLRKKYESASRQINLDIAHLKYPSFLSCAILTEDYHLELKQIVEFMQQLEDQNAGIKSSEILKMKRILEWVESEQPKTEKRNQIDFYLFISQYDLRRKTNFLATFPEMKNFYHHCQKLTQESV